MGEEARADSSNQSPKNRKDRYRRTPGDRTAQDGGADANSSGERVSERPSASDKEARSVPIGHSVPIGERLPLTQPRKALRRMFQFAWTQLQCCLFPIAIFLGLAVSMLVWGRYELPLTRYDAMLIYVVLLQILLVWVRFETWRELLVICSFHVLGLALEIFKVSIGSWNYPDAGLIRLAGVPIFSGFMYASVGSYICQAFRRFDLRVTRFRWLPVSLLAVAAYANFFTHHYIRDLRWVIVIGFLIALWKSTIHFTVGGERYWMPTALAFLLIGLFLWVAENAATFLNAWRYPNQSAGWEMVHVGKLGSWALLITLSFVLVAAVKAKEGAFYGDDDAVPRVTHEG